MHYHRVNESNLLTGRYPLPNLGGLSCCGINVCAGDQPTLNRGWASASWERRQELIADHTYFEMGAYYFLAHDVTGPNAAAVKHKFSSYGLCADEYQAFGHVPPQLYVLRPA